MADHSELINELPMVEKMPTQERLKHAKKRRAQQLKKWSQREKEHSRDVTTTKKKKTDQNLHKKSKRNDFKVHFVPGVMLLEAAARGDIDEVRRLLLDGVDPNSTNEDGLTAIHQCCIDNNEDMMKLLIEYGANVNAEDSEKWTPLHAAATCGHLNLVKYLITKQANLLAVNADGNMPYDICDDEKTLDFIESEMAKRGVTQELIDNTRNENEREMLSDLNWIAQQKGNLEYRDSHGASPLHIASANGYLSVVKFLLDQNVPTDVVDEDLWQPIHAAACWGHLEVLELLVKNGASLDAKTKNGETPFDICEDLEMKDKMVQLKDEIEYKRSTQPQRPKRTQSQNTRSQSVRRTSINNKKRMTRQDALDEAKVRFETVNSEMEKQETELDNREKPLPKLTVDKPQPRHAPVERPRNIVVVAPYPKQPDIEQQNNNKLNSQTTENTEKEASTNMKMMTNKNEGITHERESHKTKTATSITPNETTANSSSSSSYTLNNMPQPVPVTHESQINGVGSGNTNTLSDLKRQRNDLRKQANVPDAPIRDTEKMNGYGLDGGGSSTGSSNGVSGIGFDNTPPSPSITMHKFTGLTADDMGPKQKYSCCKIL